MLLNGKKAILASLLVLSSTIYADGLENSNSKHKATSVSEKPANSKIKRLSTASDSFERKKMYKTKYFKIYYDHNSVKQAQELIRVADEIAETEAKLFKMEIPKDIKVYVIDTQDDSNAFSTGFGIHLFITNNGGITNQYKDYIPYLFSHELTHELIDYKITENGINKYIPMTDQIVKSAAIPRWWTEGMAVMVESMISQGGGRTFDPGFIKIAKRDYNEENFKGVGPTFHNNPYEYGNSFMRFYLETFGVEKVSEALDYFSKHKTFGIGKAYAHVAGMSGDELYDKWQGFLAKIVDDAKGDLVEGPSVFDNHSANNQLIKDGSNVWTYTLEKNESATTTSGHTRYKFGFLKIPFDSDGNPKYSDVKKYPAPTDIMSNQPAIKGNYIYYATYPKTSTARGSIDNLAYRYDVKTGEQTLLNLKRPDKFVNIDGKIYYTFLQGGTTGISTLSNQVVLNPSKYSISSLSNGGENKILFTAKVEGEEGSKIFLLDLQTKDVKFLGMGKTASLDGNTLYFTDSFGEEVNNVYKKDLNSDKVTKLTNVLYGANTPLVVDVDSDDKDSKEKKKKLVYLNYTTNGDSVSTLDMKYAVNKTESLSALEGERKSRKDKNFALYGDYGRAYNPNVASSVSVEELDANQEKEVKGFFFPDFTKPSITLSTDGVGVGFNSANLNTRLLLSYDTDSFYTGTKGYVTPANGASQDITAPDSGALPLYWTVQKKDNKTDNYSLAFIHSFSSFSDTQFGYFHSEYVKHGASYGHLNGRDSEGKKYRTHADEMFLLVPFNIPTINKSVYVGVHTYGDFQNNDVKAGNKIWDNKIKLEFGYDRYSSYLTGAAKTKFGMVIKNKKTNDGNDGTNYFYVDRDIKYDLPYVKSLSFLSLRGRLYFSPKTFTDTESSLTQLTANGLGYCSVGNNSDSVRTFITNARFAGKLYGQGKYTIPIEKGTDFGMLYLKDVQFRLGYSYVGFMDEDYKGREQSINYFKAKYPEDYKNSQTLDPKEAEKYLDGELGSAIAVDKDYVTSVYQYAVQSKTISSNKTLTPDEYTQLGKLMAVNANLVKDPAKKAKILKLSKDLINHSIIVSNAEFIQKQIPQKERKFRHGITINPAISLNGNIFADSGDFTIETGNTYMSEFTDDKLTDTDFWYISASLRF